MKKYLFIIPLCLCLILNLSIFSSYAYDTSSDTDFDYSVYHREYDDYADIFTAFDFSKYDCAINNHPGYDDYLYYVTSTKDSFDNYLSGSSTFRFELYFFDLSAATFDSDDYSIYSTCKVPYTYVPYAMERNNNFELYGRGSGSIYIRIDKLSGLIEISTTCFSDSSHHDQSSVHYDPNKYIWVYDTNVSDLKFDSDLLNVSVNFSPSFSGIVDRNVSGSFVSSFKMDITNNSSRPIQYRMAIFEGVVSSFDSCLSPYSNPSCIFTYMSYDWVYCKDVSQSKQLTATSNLLLQNTGTAWHYLDKKSSFSQTFNYSQINFSKDKNYSVVVEAALIDLDHPSGYFVDNIASLNRVENLDPDRVKYILDYSTFSTVFSSTFSFDSLKGISYDSSDNSFGIIANNSSDDYSYAIHDRQAFYDDNGNFDFTSYNPYDDEDSYIYNPPLKTSDEREDNIFYDDSSNLSSVYNSIAFSSGDFSFGNGFFNFGNLIGSVFNIFPSDFLKIFTFGVISIVVIAIVKAVK